MNKINWKQKLASRKLWAAILAVLVSIFTAVFKTDLTPEIVELIEKGLTALYVYIAGEGAVDAVRLIWTKTVTEDAIDLTAEYSKGDEE